MCDKNPWTQYEDESLTFVVNEHKHNLQWCVVEQILREKFGIKNRTGKQCRERWTNNLDPNCRKREWTVDEDQIIFNYQQRMGNNWSKIATFLVGRSDNTIKNHFYATIRRKIRRYNKINENKITLPLKKVINDKEMVKMLIETPDKEKVENCTEIRRSSRINQKRNEDDNSEEFKDTEDKHTICIPLPVKNNSIFDFCDGLSDLPNNHSGMLSIASGLIPMNSLGTIGFFGNFDPMNSFGCFNDLGQGDQSFKLSRSFQMQNLE